MVAMERGIRQAVAYARRHLGIRAFPDVYALIVATDADGVYEPFDGRCNDDDDFSNSDSNSNSNSNSSSNSSSGSEGLPWPPIFGQNVRFRADNLFVMLPDFSFFSAFEHGEDHGTKADVWFDVVDREVTRRNTTYGGVPFGSKDASAVYRGKMSARKRKWGALRQALLPALGCNASLPSPSNPLPMLDVGSDHARTFKSKADMCRGHQLVVTLPGNGAWSWATKFNLLCNSVTAMVRPEDAGGASWETRPSLGLVPVRRLGLKVLPGLYHWRNGAPVVCLSFLTRVAGKALRGSGPPAREHLRGPRGEGTLAAGAAGGGRGGGAAGAGAGVASPGARRRAARPGLAAAGLPRPRRRRRRARDRDGGQRGGVGALAAAVPAERVPAGGRARRAQGRGRGE